MAQLTPEQHKLVKHELEELKTPSKTLTTWETGFLESVTDQYDNKLWLSEKQLEILDRIYTDKTA